ncbi:MAG TPA: aldehyde dehydrogenase family protein, partial [Nocardioides sp.]|nr:aldehyde dehydrogenase family protein [Nocardioides sp.]
MTAAPSTFTVVNPATEQPVVDVPLTDLAGTDAAIAAAHEAFQTWKAIAPGERASLLRRLAAVVDAHIDELAELEVRN